MARKKKGFRDPLFDPDHRLFSPPSAECWHGVCLRSQVPRGRVIGMVHPPLPEGMRLYGPDDIPGNESFQVNKVRFPLLSHNTVHYIGEPLFLVVGEAEAVVRAFAFQVRFVVVPEQNEPAAGITRFLSRGVVPENSEGSGFRVVESSFSSGAQDHGRFDALEVLAHVTQGTVAVKVRSQWPAHVVSSVARALDLDPAKVQVLATTTAGVTGNQVWFPSLYAVYAALLSQACGKPVVLRLTRQEDFHVSPKKPECKTFLKSLVASDGRLLSLSAQLELQTGAWPVMAEEILDRALVGLLTPYHLPHFEVQGRVQTSPTPPRGPVGTQGEGLGLFALESHVDDICRELDIDPVRWRQQNAVVVGQPWFTGLVPKTENPLRWLLAETSKATDFSRKYAAYGLLSANRKNLASEALPLKGIGVASAFQGNGLLAGGNPVHLEGRLDEDGQLSLYIPLVSPNERQSELWKAQAAATLQIPQTSVRICPVFTGEHPTGGPSLASRAFEMVPRLIVQTCEALAQKRLKQALPVTVKSVFRRSKTPPWDSEAFTGQPFLSFSWCSAVAEVQVIPHRAEVEIVRLTLVVDAGPRVDEAAARNALFEGAQMAVGWALTEVFHFDVSGHDSGYHRYRLPGPRELPPLAIRFLEGSKELRPRGLGNLGAHAMAPALFNAIRQALGSSLPSIPVSRKMLDEALREPVGDL